MNPTYREISAETYLLHNKSTRNIMIHKRMAVEATSLKRYFSHLTDMKDH